MGNNWEKAKGNLRKVFSPIVPLTINGILFAVYLTLVGLPQKINREFYERFPTNVRTEFQKEYGVKINGYPSDIEHGGEKIIRIANILYREQCEKDFKLENIFVESPNIIFRSAKMISTDICVKFPVGGLQDGYDVHIDNSGLEALTHEIKHSKQEQKRGFIEKWKDRISKTLRIPYYDHIGINKESYNEEPTSEDYKAGFVSDYARTNELEHIAETAEYAEYLRVGLKDILGNPVLSSSIHLLQEDTLISPEFMQYLTLKDQFDTPRKILETAKPPSPLESGILSAEKTDAKKDYFMEVELYLGWSSTFLHQHPNSVYAMEIYRERAEMLNEMGLQLKMPEKYTRMAIDELEKGLDVKFKDIYDYPINLLTLAEYYQKIHEPQKTALYLVAGTEFYRRMKTLDVGLPKHGVSDFISTYRDAPIPLLEIINTITTSK